MKIKSIARFIKYQLYWKKHPVEYAKMIGVNILGGVKIYGKVEWSTEPWLITIGDNVHITNGARFITHDGGTLIFRKDVPDLEITKPITIGNDVYFGNNAMVMPGCKIGNKVIIGAGAVVTKDIPDNSVAVGVPARVIKTADEYFEKLQKESLHLGHLRGEEKDKALKEYFHYQGSSKGIYY